MSVEDSGEPQIDWESCTFEGAEREQLRVWSQLPLRNKLEALEEMCDHARATIERRRQQGLPYIDPYTGERIPRAATVREEPDNPSSQA